MYDKTTKLTRRTGIRNQYLGVLETFRGVHTNGLVENETWNDSQWNVINEYRLPCLHQDKNR